MYYKLTSSPIGVSIDQGFMLSNVKKEKLSYYKNEDLI